MDDVNAGEVNRLLRATVAAVPVVEDGQVLQAAGRAEAAAGAEAPAEQPEDEPERL